MASRKKYEYLPHTADVSFVAYGKDFGEALENAAEALLNIMLDLKRIKKEKAATATFIIRESADKADNLVWYVLQDILSQVDEKKLLAYAFQVEKLERKRGKELKIQGKLLFKKLEKDLFLLEVKAVTPHELTVEKKNAGYEIRVTVDV